MIKIVGRITMNRAMRRIAKSKRGGKRYMQSSREANSAINKVFAKQSMRKSIRNKQGVQTINIKNNTDE